MTFGNLNKRLISSLFIPIFFFAPIFIGGWVLSIMMSIMGTILCWEWQKMSNLSKINSSIHRKSGFNFYDLTILVFMSFIVSIGSLLILNIGIENKFMISIVFIILAIAIKYISGSNMTFLGVLYIGLFIQSFAYLLIAKDVFFIIRMTTIIWAFDIGGFFFGKLIGGKKIQPSISPNKTWSGVLGGIALALLFSEIFGMIIPWWNNAWHFYEIILICSFGLIGDLLISMLKRNANISDTSNIIPGHGGFFDRFDSFILATIGMALFILIERLVL